MKLEEAKLCVNCDNLYDNIGDCPKCGSEIFWKLKNWVFPMFDRQTKLSQSEIGEKDERRWED